MIPGNITLKFKRLTEGATYLQYATEGAACFDLHADFTNGVEKGANTLIVGTGLGFEIPEGWQMLIFSRSGHGFKNDTRLANCVGVIDSDYRGEVKVKLTTDGSEEFKVEHGDRIAQAQLVPTYRAHFLAVNELSTTQRGTGGFGSTGK